MTRRGFVLGAAGLLVPLAGAGRAAAAGAVQPAQVQTWGSNDAQQLGRRTRYLTDVAGPVPGLGDVGQVAAFGSSTYVVRQDGTVLGWGSSTNGELGAGAPDPSRRAVRIAGLPPAVAVVGGYPMMALDRRGRVWEWASMGAHRPSDVPRQVRGIPGEVVQVAPLDHYGGATALLADGRLVAWGRNRSGELGTGGTEPRWRPGPVPGLPPVAAVAGRWGSVWAVTQDGEVWAWGRNDGVLGFGDDDHRLRPVRVPGLTGVVRLTVGDGFVVALRDDGTLRSWGRNFDGTLGDGTFRHRARPGRVLGIDEVVGVSAGLEFVAALRADGSVWAWGTNRNGQLGRVFFGSRATPRRVPGVSRAVEVSAGMEHTVALVRP